MILDDIMYKTTIIVEYKMSPEELEKILKEENVDIPEECKQPLDENGGLCYTLSRHCILIRLKDKPNDPASIAILVHELTHATNSILRMIGMEFSEDSEEAYTYHTEWLVRETLNFFGKKRKM